ncbi:sialic acid-binding Ig-like lectin 13 isoform X1 [Pseudophryne corroboree]|uniref:sialic acid-binding Ig-like lectin 13 isoform X1 n=1 Tax=Pseudophryne corroboree TaxID=495146 RepID=UPI0030818D42
MPGNLNEGDCTLTMTDARREDSGQYIFRFEESPTSRIKYNYENSLISVNITDLTRMPEISIPEKIISGQEVTLTCSFPVDCPGTILIFQWSRSDQDGIWKNSSTVTFTLCQNNHNISVTCKVILPAVMASTKRTINLDVYSPPTTIITREINDCGNVDSKIIAGIVAGNVIILILISLGIFCFVKRYMEKKLLGNGRNKREETEPTYQDLKGQNDIYSIINTQ